jgi:hypothetical protein
MKKKIGCLLTIFCCFGFCKAQQVVSSGGYSVKSEISVNWIIGGSLSDISVLNPNMSNKVRSEQMAESMLSLKVYPTPATDVINIEITPIDTGRLSLEIFNTSGVKVIDKTFYGLSEMQISVSELPAGVYFLKLLSFNKEQLFKTEKIIKN